MTATFGYLLMGWLMLVSALREQPVADVLRGALAPPGQPGPGERGFTSSILGELGGSGAGSAGGSATASAGGPVPAGMATVDGHPVCAWIAHDLKAARRNGWRGQVSSGYRTEAEQAAACAHTSGPCAKPGESNHQGKAWPSCAVDVSDPAGLARALPKGSRLRWTGKSIGDDVHFSSGKHGV